jgi:hypothetical protein
MLGAEKAPLWKVGQKNSEQEETGDDAMMVAGFFSLAA